MCWQDVYLETERLEEEKNRYTPFFFKSVHPIREPPSPQITVLPPHYLPSWP